jgi:DtxR family Mn-dependent transcriptional regulator
VSHTTSHPPRLSLPHFTRSEEEYLEAIYMLEKQGKEPTKVKKLAETLGVKDPSVVEMLRKLKRAELVKYDRSGVKLTSKGRGHAVKVVRRHELAERLLADVFRYPLPKVHEMACKFEHVLDDELTERIEKILGNPETCPHGSPIPRQNGGMEKIESKPLTEISKGEGCRVMKIPEERGSVARLLALNVIPGAEIKVLERLPRGAIVLLCGSARVALSRDIASQIEVRAVSPARL